MKKRIACKKKAYDFTIIGGVTIDKYTENPVNYTYNPIQKPFMADEFLKATELTADAEITGRKNGRFRDGDAVFFLKEGRYHREDGPAVIRPGYRAYYRNGELHREDGPAVITKRGSYFYRSGCLRGCDE